LGSEKSKLRTDIVNTKNMKKFIISIVTVLAVMAFVPSFAHANFEECRPTDFTADMYILDEGEGTVLHWDSTGCDEARIDPAAYPDDRPPYGSVSTGRIDQTTVFTLTVYDVDGNIGGQRSLTVQIRENDHDDDDDDDHDNDQCEIDNFDADDTTIEEGDSTELSWDTTDCDEVRINQGIGEVDLDGSEDVDPNSSTTYTLSAYKDGDLEDTDTVRIVVEDEEEEDDECSIDEFKADDYSINSGDSVRISWKTTGADSVDISPGYNNRAEDGNVTVSPSSTTTYRLEVDCDSGSSKSKTLTITVGRENSSQPQAVTTVATVTSSTTAQLNGIAFPNTSSGNTTAWFQWGPSTSVNFTTSSQSVPTNTGANYYNAPVSGLVPGTQYYYRAVVKNENGTAYGDIVPFRSATATPSTTIVRTVQVSNSVVAKSAPSLLELRVDSAYDRMCVEGTIDYTVTYRNISTQTLQDAVLQINHQKEVTFVSSSRGAYDVLDRTITVDLGDLSPGETGTIILHGRINNAAVQGTLTVMTAQVVYTNGSTRAQESAIAYSLVTITDDCPNILGASAIGFGNFLPDTLLEWLLLIVIILALIVLGRNLYRQPRHVTPVA
jgi:hypothetical protein